ncbi:tetraacyldisaccharide 4'-kinase [Flagellimonas myxillae]|uniref:tetraacyldisaccharide 4'-kinase n=1 Tax=Flagellimonas myxillae TaxID=2942214 RepID=UPI00201F3762|nr:tetraacyldisaccharide 4'-kinase [Muricauda myxillae]MCL6268044.1 tetraacyldisaccharide 4'-kinase [Muricauda myxillae]
MLQILRKIAFPFSLIYALVIHIRNFLFDIGVFKSKSYNTPTICIGNLSVGGTGKTPMIECLVRMLEGHKVAVLSRGYRRKTKGFLLADQTSSVSDLGDEPFQIHKKFPSIYVAVDADRRNGIEQLEKLVHPDVILLDDAFQHRKVKPTFSILLTSYGKLYSKDWYLPTGNLRDSKREARRANLIIVTKCPIMLSQAEKSKTILSLKPAVGQKVLFSSLAYAKHFKNTEGKEVTASEFNGKQIALVTGIASPAPLVSHLKDENFEFQHLQFGDHHDFSPEEINRMKQFDVVLTTEKDFVRLQGKLEQLYYLEIAHAFGTEDQALLEKAVKDQI